MRRVRSIWIRPWVKLSRGVHRLDGRGGGGPLPPLIILDVDAVLAFDARIPAQPDASEEVVMKALPDRRDSAVIRRFARRILEGLSFRTSEAEDGEQALEPLPLRDAGCCPARLEHARDGRLFLSAGMGREIARR